MKPVKFNEYITEETEVKKFRLLIITDEPKEAKTFHTADRLREEAEKKGVEISDPDARMHVYGMPYSEWKEKYQK